MNRIKQLCDLLRTLTYGEMMEVAALADFAQYHFDGDAEE